MEISAKLQTWKCHKTVRAGKIANISSLDVISTTLAVETPLGLVHCTMSAEWMARHMPEVGGYLVAYDDKYVSYSPAKAFEDGYHKVASPFLNPPPAPGAPGYVFGSDKASVREVFKSVFGFEPPLRSRGPDLTVARRVTAISHETQALIWGNLHEKIMGEKIMTPFEPGQSADPLNRAERALYDNLTLSLARSLDPLASL